MKIRAVFFDLDDTLLPSEALYKSGLRLAWNALNHERPISWPRFCLLYVKARKDVKSALSSSPSSRNRILYFKRLVELLFGHDRPVTVLALTHAYDGCWRMIEPKKFKAVVAALATRFTVGVITNQTCLMQLQKMERIDPQGRIFKILVTSEEVGVEKPNPLIFNEACRRARCRPDQAILIGDSWAGDIQGARRAGMHVAYWHPGQLRTRLPADIPVIRRIDELPALLGANYPQRSRA